MPQAQPAGGGDHDDASIVSNDADEIVFVEQPDGTWRGVKLEKKQPAHQYTYTKKKITF